MSREEILSKRYPPLVLILSADIAYFIIILSLPVFVSLNSCSLHKVDMLSNSPLNIGGPDLVVGDHVRPVPRKSKRSLKLVGELLFAQSIIDGLIEQS